MADALLSAEFKFEDNFDLFEKQISDTVLMEGVAAAAKVFYDEAKLNASGVRGHPKIVSGNLYNSIYRAYSPEQSSFTVKTYRISWNKSKAPHGHLIEFGTSKAPAYPFLRPAYNKATLAGQAGIAAMTKSMTDVAVA